MSDWRALLDSIHSSRIHTRVSQYHKALSPWAWPCKQYPCIERQLITTEKMFREIAAWRLVGCVVCQHSGLRDQLGIEYVRLQLYIFFFYKRNIEDPSICPTILSQGFQGWRVDCKYCGFTIIHFHHPPFTSTHPRWKIVQTPRSV